MKKFTALILCLLMIVTFSFAGCATFSIDPVKYYNEVVAVVGNTKIKRFELVNAYNSYGYTFYVSQQGLSEQEAMTQTIQLLADREALYQYGLSNKEMYKPTPYQMNELIGTMFDSIDSQLDEYLQTAKQIYKVEDKSTPEQAESTTNNSNNGITNYYYNYNGVLNGENFESKRRATVEKVGDEYKLKYTYTAPTVITDYVLGFENADYLTNYETEGVKLLVDVYFDKYEEKLTEDYGATNELKLMAKVKNLLVSNLMNYEYYLRDENNKPYNTLSDDLIFRYFERTFASQLKSQYLTNIRTKYLEDADYLNTETLINRATKLVKTSHDKYYGEQRAQKYNNDIINIGTNGDSVYYHPYTGNVKYGYFIHTLLSFSDSQKNYITALGEITDDNRTEYYAKINETMVTERDLSGNELGERPISEVLNEYVAFANDPSTSNEVKLQQFIEFMFKYTGDADSSLVPGMPYVVGYDSTKNQADLSDEDLQKYSKMARAFTIEASNLMKEGLQNNTTGCMSKIELTNSNTAKLNYSNMCVTEYGIHLLYYVGEVNAFDLDCDLNGNLNSNYYIGTEEDDNQYNLTNKIINPLTNETYLDMLFDLVYPATSSTETYSSNNGYSAFERNKINLYKYQPYDDRINATKASI